MSDGEAAQSAPSPLGAAAPEASDAPRDVSAREAAWLLGVNERTIRRAILRGDLSAVKRGRAFRITPAALDRYRLLQRLPSSPALPPPAPAGAARLAPSTTRLRPPMLPAPLTGFIGREHEIAAVADLVRRPGVRLVTLTGPGGVGKTRLALEAARAAESGFPDGAAFVSLAPIRNPDLVLPAIAGALGVREAAGRPLADLLATALHGRRLLLVLDNAEHLPGAANDLAGLLAACPAVAVLATSRSPLRLGGERLVATRPLTLPGPGAAIEPDRLLRYEAVALFVERARQMRPDFALDGGNAAAVAKICRRLDGLPLAIELAASWIRVLSPETLLGRLERRLPLLTGGSLDQPARLRTMRDAIAWSHDLLSEDEQRLFRRLSVFVGGFTLEAAERIAIDASQAPGSTQAAPSRQPTPVTLQILASLIDKSLVQQAEVNASEPRYAMLETVREFGLECLAECGETATVAALHAAYYLSFAEDAASSAAGAGGGEWLHRLAADEGNLRAALDWLEAGGQVAEVLRLAGALWHFWYRHGDLAEGRARLERALAAASPAVAPRIRALALRGAGVLAWQSGDYAWSRQRLDQALAAYEALGDRAGVAWVLNGLGCLCATQSDLAQAEPLLAEALAIFSALGDAVGIAQLTANLGELAVGQGRNDLAGARLERALAMWRDLGDRVGAARAQVYLGQALLAQDQAARAEAVLMDALAAIRDIGYGQMLPAAMRAIAHQAARRGAAAEAARWFGAEERVRETQGRSLPAAGRAAHEQTLAGVQAALGAAAFHAAWAEGHADPSGVVAAALAARESVPAAAAQGDETGPGGISGLSARERDVLRLVANGRSDREIAAALFVTRRTASKHVSAILAKLGVPSRTAAAAIAHRERLA